MRRVLLALIAFIAFPAITLAADVTVYWYSATSFIGSGTSTGTTRYPSANAACAAVVPAGYSEGYGYANQCYAKLGGTTYAIGSYKYNSEQCTNGANGLYCVAVGGESCEGSEPPLSGFGHIKNSAGECVDFTRADTPSQCKSLGGTSGFTNVQISFGSDGSPIPPPPMDVQGCAAVPGPTAHCKMAPERCTSANGLGLCMQSSTNTCRIAVSFTGATAGDGSILPIGGNGEDGVCPPGEDCTPPTPPDQREDKPCNYVYDGEGRKVCDSSQWQAKPGETSCGLVNGQMTCIGKAPTSNGINIGTKIEEKQNADGTTTTTKTDTVTETNCNGANSCQTKTTTNKTVVIKDGNGNKVSETGECTGPHCKTGSGDANGDGLSDCIGANCNGEEEGEDEEFSGPENDEVATFADATSDFIVRVEGSPIISAARGLSFSAGGGACSFGSFNVPMLGTLSFQPMCAWAADWFGPIRVIMLCVWALVAVRTFFEA